MTVNKSGTETVRKLRKWYIAALSILLSMLLLSQIIIQFAIRSNEDDSRVVNIAGRQRMLSQRISKSVFGLYFRTDEKDYKRYLNELDTSVELWKQSHEGLKAGDEKLGLPGKNSPEIVSMFLQLEPAYKAITDAADEVRRLASNPLYNNKDLLPSIQIIRNTEQDFLRGMDAIVFQYDYEFGQKVKRIGVIEVVIFLLSIIILGLEALFILRPALMHVRSVIEEVKTFLDVNIDILCVSDKEGKFYKVNKRFEETLGYKADEVEGKNFIFFVHEEDIPATQDVIKELSEKEVLLRFINRFRCKDGTYKYIDWYSQPGSGKYIYFSARDVTEKKAMEDKLINIAVRDELTGQYNRHYFDIVINEEMDRADRYNENISMLLLDLDHFKNVNDTWGHPVGDELLRHTAGIMGKTKRSSDILIRFGGEEFLLLMPHTSVEDAAAAAEKIRAAVEKNNHPVTGVQTVSIGAAERMGSESFRHWYKRVDDALYKAKQSGRNRVVCSREESESILKASVMLEWNSQWESGNAEIDKQHREMIEAADRLIELSLSGRGYQEILQQLEVLLKHVTDHFDYEEKVLSESGYPEKDVHYDIHRNLLSKAMRLKEAYKKEEVRPLAFFSFIVDDVILGHLVDEDVKFYPYLCSSESK